MQEKLFSYIWRHTRAQQIYVLLVILVSMPFYFLSLDLPKSIVNGPIQGKGFEAAGAAQLFLRLEVGNPFGEGSVLLFPGITMERLPYLVAMSLLFLLLVAINGWFKWYINLYKGRLGERMLRRLRYDLVDRVLRFPPSHFKRLKAPEVATMVKDEVEPLGGFIGDAFTQPLFLGGQALTAMVFIIVQSLWLGLIAGGIVLLQAILMPKLRQRLLVLGRERQLGARDLAGRVGEMVDGIGEIRVNDATNWERADLSRRLGRIYFIRLELYNRKFFVKFLNNFLSQVTPFLFYLVGGYYAIKGELDIGQLVAVIAAYKELPSPIKELIDWDQQRQDVEIKYSQVMEQFAPDAMIDPAQQRAASQAPKPIDHPIEFSRLTVTDDTGATLVENVSFTLAPGERVAVIGQVNAGGESVSEALVRLLWPTAGRIRLQDTDLGNLPDSVLGRRIGYSGPAPYLPNLSIRECLVYGLRHVPISKPSYVGDRLKQHHIELTEAAASGNTDLDSAADWIDYAAAGVADRKGLERRLIEVLKLVELDEDVHQQGLRSRIDPVAQPDLVAGVLRARAELRRKLDDPELGRLVEPFDPARYNRLASVAENLLFGTAVSAAFEPAQLPTNPHVLKVLSATGLDEALFEMGRRIAETVLELFGDLPPNHPFFEQLSFMAAEDLPDYRAITLRAAGQRLASATADDRQKLLRLPFSYIESRHRFGLMSEALEAQIVKARAQLRAALSAQAKGAVDFFEPDQYNAASSLQDNILFGRVAHGIANGPERVQRLVQQLLDELGLDALVHEAGLSFMVGAAGKRLTQSQRQKIAVARALLKRPDILVMNRALSTLDQKSQRAILDRLIALSKSSTPPITLFCVLTSPQAADAFDRVLCFEDGQLGDDGTPALLKSKGGLYAKLTA